MTTKKHIALLLALLTLGSTAACSEAIPAEETMASVPAAETAAPAETTEATAQDARRAIPDNLPTRDFGGEDFAVIGSNSSATEKYIAVEDLNGERVNDAVHQRNSIIDERFNAKVAYVEGGAHRDCTTRIGTEIQAGDTSFDLIQYHVVSNSGNVLKGYYMNWKELDYIDFSQPWWSDSTVDDLTINDRCYLAMGDFALTTISKTYCMYYDKQEMVNYQVENLYDVVKEGRWTIDYLAALCEKVYTDLDGNGTEGEGDYFGLASDTFSNYNTYLWACDNPIYVKDAQGEHQFVYYSEHLVDVYGACHALINKTVGVIAGGNHDYGMDLFSRKGTLTCNGTLDGAITYMADFENEYGIIPYPKYDENQAEYKSMVDGSHEAMAVAKSAQNLEFIGIITEALCAESYKEVLPIFYDVCLKQRYASSPEDAEMIDLCVDARVFDFGYVYDNWQGVSFFFQDLLKEETFQDITAFYKRKQKPATRHYEGVIELFYADEAVE